MTQQTRLTRLEAAAAKLPAGPCPSCGQPRRRLVVVHNLRPLPPGADCPTCEAERLTITIRRVRAEDGREITPDDLRRTA
ncbi:MAG TPA: hypothetical protein VFS08_10455 [Gemmatimonadaceae bacterium]|nr:hypothetical protein [Gemmatimonadaceae bacterium]